MTAGFTSAVLGVAIAVGILWLVRRDRMHGGYALWWLAVAIGALLIGFFPGVIDWVGAKLGVHYPPMLLVLGALAAIVLKLAAADIDATLRERRLRRLLQKVAILELELKTLRMELDVRDAAAQAARDPVSPAVDASAAPIRRAAV
ncbi:DUF2304 domain-containing protein [Chiayiivirga flava]|uniref:DUF2304 domain-containing protein n=1 Tax=Chiayiivirga flava TaxID=659595 RepID=A0A7W8D4F5_9GAMM|nr:DUF2304 domain-containing protein [Chiayiivirga flava]MBB5207327.1 hypothetical protein [Chiayiivirga flava]